MTAKAALARASKIYQITGALMFLVGFVWMPYGYWVDDTASVLGGASALGLGAIAHFCGRVFELVGKER